MRTERHPRPDRSPATSRDLDNLSWAAKRYINKKRKSKPPEEKHDWNLRERSIWYQGRKNNAE